MFKKTLLFTLIIASTTIAQASTPYLGGSIGIADIENLNNHTSSGALGKIVGGYGSLVGINNNIYVGGELNADLGLGYSSYNGTTYGLGASFMPGLMITPEIMLYGRAGYQATRSTKSSTISYDAQLGLGLQTALSKNWDVRTEYVNVFGIENRQVNLGFIYKFSS